MTDRIIRVLCTLGPASLNQNTIERLQERKVDLFRINLSHTPLDKLEEAIECVQKYGTIPICLDTEGAQVRTGTMSEDVVVCDRQRVRLVADNVVGTASCFTLTPPSLFDSLEPNNLIGLDFDGAVLLVLEVGDGYAETVVLNGGRIGHNKAVGISPAPGLPPVTKHDIASVRVGRKYGIEHYALSFANCAEDVARLRAIAGRDSRIIAKIESREGVLNLDEILAETDEIVIDRGDLSREVPLENIPLLQKAIIRKANMANKPVNVATNLLESMLVNRKPNRAEVNDIMNTLLDGANGLVLAAETAIGNHPISAVDMVLSLIERYRRSLDGYRISDLLESAPLLLPSLHGRNETEDSLYANLVHVAPSIMESIPSITIDAEIATDIELLAHGVYSPLDGFMTQEMLESVLDSYRLPIGDVWTMPIVLQGRQDHFAPYQPGQSLRLHDHRTGQVVALLFIEDKFQVDLASVAKRWFGTADQAHPGVKRLMNRGNVMLGGPVDFPVDFLGPAEVVRSPYHLTPEQTRTVFEIKGWSRIAAFHTHSVPHRGDEHLIANACERANADGLLIHPVIGPTKAGDFQTDVILGAYEKLIALAYPNALLAAFSTYSRHCGPRETVFSALCRKNFGCTHFVLGRDRTDVVGCYDPHEDQALFEKLGDIGITPIFFDTVYYSQEQRTTVESGAPNKDDFKSISDPMIRELLRKRMPVPDWCMREAIASWLQHRLDSGAPVFVE